MAFGNPVNKNHSSRRTNRAISDINVTPFVDVLLVLLIIFMIAAPMMTGSVEIDLPEGASNKIINNVSDPISISVKADGSIYLQDEKIKLRPLPKRLLQITNNNIDSKIFINADKQLNYGRVMEIIKVINSTGFKQVVLVTELSEEK